jgi:hypothetical protein
MATIPAWDAAGWLTEWNATGATSSSLLPLIGAVMESTAARSITNQRSGISTTVNVLQLIQHAKGTTGSELCDVGPTVTPGSEVVSLIAATVTEAHDGSGLSPQRRLLVVVRDMSLCGPDALHLGVAPSDMLHTSSRVLLQTELCDRVGWWSSGSDASGLSSLTRKSESGQQRSTDLNPIGSLVVRTSKPNNPSRSGVLECTYVPDVAWLRHGAERGFAWRDRDEHGEAVVDVIAVGFDTSQDSNIKNAVCKQRLVSVLHTGVMLASMRSDGAPIALVVDVGMKCAGSAAWSQLQQCALEAASHVASLLKGRCNVEVNPSHQLPGAKVTSVAPAPVLLTRPCPAHASSADAQTERVASPPTNTSVQQHADSVQKETDHQAAVVTTSAPPPKVDEDDDDDQPLWHKYQDRTRSDTGGAKRLLCSTAAEHNAQPPRPAPVEDRGPYSSGPTEAIFIEVASDVTSVALSMLGASSVFRQVLARWYQPMLQRWQPPAPPGPLRAVIFLCLNETMLSELLLAFAEVAHDDNIYVPYLFAVGQSRRAGIDTSMQFASQSEPESAPSGDGPSDNTQRLQQMMAYLQARLPRLARDKSILVTCTEPLRQSSEIQREWSKSRVLHVPQLWSETGANGTTEVLAPLLAMIEKKLAKSLPSSSATDLAGLGSDQVDRIRRRVALATAPVFPRVLHQLFTKPRRPEVAINFDRVDGIFVGVVRPPSSVATARCGGGHHTIAPRSVRVTKDERATVLDAIRVVFAQEYRAAMDVLQTSRQRESKKHTGKFIPYLAGYCPLFVGARRIRLSSVVRRNVFTEVELNLQDVQQRLRGLVDQCRACAVHAVDNMTAALESVALHVLPQVKCSCVPRIGEPAPRVLAGARRQLKLCRHVVQVVCHFLDVYTQVDDGASLHPSAPPRNGAPPPRPEPKKRSRLVLAADAGASTGISSGPGGAAKQHRTELPRVSPQDPSKGNPPIAHVLPHLPAAVDFMKELRYVPDGT